jgi:hypothetical protein
MSPTVNHYYSSDSQISDIRHSRRAQVTETQPGSHPLRLTGMYSRLPLNPYQLVYALGYGL